MPRPEIIDWVEENTGLTECAFYASMTYGAYGAAVKSLLSAQFWLTGGLALVGRAAELTAQAQGCFAQPPPVNPSAGQCWKTDGAAFFQYTANGGWTGPGDAVYVEILSQEVYVASDGKTKSKGQVLRVEGTVQNYNWTHTDPSDTQVRLSGAPCTGEAPDPDPVHNPGDPIADPVTHTDSEGCNWTIQATDAYVDASGVWHTYYTITADNDACGGPFAYWSSESGEPKFVTDPGNDPEGEPYPPPPPTDYQPDFEDIEDKIDKIKEELDAVKDCACGDPKPELLGDWISIRFVSDGISPNGTAPLRKLFRYRSQSSRTEQQLRDYWAGFTWQAGPVIVWHSGAWWGQPKVWASSVEEGKRVLRFAAGEAGLDADTDGEWNVTGSNSPRYGMSGTMRVQQYRGRDWVTQRIGPSGPVEL